MSNKILNTLSTTLPDDRPITSLQIIESVDRCPGGFIPISRTHDQDQDADLWREGSFLKRKSGRYLCLSKSEGLPGFVVQEILIFNEKGIPPAGYSLLTKTADSDQKAWRKKQLCYKLVNKRNTKTAVTDIIVCSRLKKAPEGFTLAGEINGVTICYKMGNVQDSQQEQNGQNGNANGKCRPAPPPPTSAGYPNLAGDEDHDYEILAPGPGYNVPARPAPARPPPLTSQFSTHTLTTNYNGLEGVPFIVNPKFLPAGQGDRGNFPVIKAKSLQQIIREYNYDFTVERQT